MIFNIYRIIFLLPIFLISACGNECYTSELQLMAKYERCSDLGTTFSSVIGKDVRTFACTTSGDDIFADFIIKNGKFCRTYRHDY